MAITEHNDDNNNINRDVNNNKCGSSCFGTAGILWPTPGNQTKICIIKDLRWSLLYDEGDQARLLDIMLSLKWSGLLGGKKANERHVPWYKKKVGHHLRLPTTCPKSLDEGEMEHSGSQKKTFTLPSPEIIWNRFRLENELPLCNHRLFNKWPLIDDPWWRRQRRIHYW